MQTVRRPASRVPPPESEATGAALRAFYDKLDAAWGPQHWWPAQTPFEVMVGAILTQNTNWTNVEKALAQLKAAAMLDPHSLHYAPAGRLAELIRPSGYYNVKARRLKGFLDFYFREGGGSEGRLRAFPTRELRRMLLEVNGLGPETVDSILLYAFGRPVFVVDAYTRRVLRRHGLIHGAEDYEDVRALFEMHLARNRGLYNQYHALFVHAGKHYCRTQARCVGCPLEGFPHRADL